MSVDNAQRLLLRLVPARLVELLARAHRPLARYLAAREHGSRTGGRLVRAVHPDDDLLHHGIGQLAHDGSRFSYFRSLQRYFDGGEHNVSELQRILAGLGAPLEQADAILEFACGHGRLTRHLVRRVSPAKLTVSDIDGDAVEFVARSFGVRGYPSASEPEALVDAARYDLILVVSFFSHLPVETWSRWLKRLHELLAPGGLLVFSTLPWQAGGSPPIPEQTAAFELGLLYSQHNETRGRLSGEQYGTSFVRTQFVMAAVEQLVEATFVERFPLALNGVQDVYVVRR